MVIESREMVDSRDGLHWVRLCYWDEKNVACKFHGTFNNWDTVRGIGRDRPGRCPICWQNTEAVLKSASYPDGCIYIDTEVEREEEVPEVSMAEG